MIRFLRGKALWSDKGLQRIIRSLVDLANPKVTTFSEIERLFGIPVQVIAADIRNGERRVYGGNDQIVNSVLDSCAVPFGFRAACSGGDSSIVDGGICENLPSDLLAEHMSSSGPVVGISFRRVPGTAPSSAISFALALMDTAISNSIQRAKRALDTDVFEIDTAIGSFDWENALSTGFKAEYDKVKYEAEKFFVSFVDRTHEQQERARREEAERLKRQTEAELRAKVQQGKISRDEWLAVASGDHWAKQYQQAMIAAGTMYRVQHSQSKILFEHCQLIVTARSLLDSGQDQASDFDEVWYKAVFRTLDQPIYCHSVGLSHADHETLLIKSEYVVIGPDQKEIETIKLLISDGTSSSRELLLCFNPVLPPQTGSYKFRFVDQVRGFTELLKQGKPDELAVTVRRAHETVPKIEIVLHVPKTYSSLRMVGKIAAGPHIGRPMSESELRTHKERAPYGLILCLP